MRYIIFEDSAGRPMPVLFPNRIGHEEMRDQMPYGVALSAGEVLHDGTGFVCTGQAKELGLSARQEDADIVSRFFAEKG